MCLKLIPRVTPLNDAGELKVLEGTHGTEPMGLLGGEVGLEKNHPKKHRNQVKFDLFCFQRFGNRFGGAKA